MPPGVELFVVIGSGIISNIIAVGLKASEESRVQTLHETRRVWCIAIALNAPPVTTSGCPTICAKRATELIPSELTPLAGSLITLSPNYSR